jgi:hypothetical protein
MTELCRKRSQRRYYVASAVNDGILSFRAQSRNLKLKEKEYIMQDYKKQFIRFMVENEVLCFGDFTLKSGENIGFFRGRICGQKPVISGQNIHHDRMYVCFCGQIYGQVAQTSFY